MAWRLVFGKSDRSRVRRRGQDRTSAMQDCGLDVSFDQRKLWREHHDRAVASFDAPADIIQTLTQK
jgi:hypothetical protein